MPIRAYLNGEGFDPETVRLMGLAFEMALASLRSGCTDPLREALARNSSLRRPASVTQSAYARAPWRTCRQSAPPPFPRAQWPHFFSTLSDNKFINLTKRAAVAKRPGQFPTLVFQTDGHPLQGEPFFARPDILSGRRFTRLLRSWDGGMRR